MIRWASDVEKVHAVVAPSTFGSQKFWAYSMELLKLAQLVKFVELVKLASYLVT